MRLAGCQQIFFSFFSRYWIKELILLHNPLPFTHQEAINLWARLVAGWTHNLNNEGSRILIDGYPNHADVGGSYEGVTRMLWALGGWLSQPDRPTTVTWRGEAYDIEALTCRALVNGCNPNSSSYWGIEYNPDNTYDQRTVETGQIAFALWQSRDRIWNKLDETSQTHIYDFLERYARQPVKLDSNWSLFWVLNHASRKALGLSYDQSIIDRVMGEYLDGVYCGDGWYDDADRRGVGYFDDYNLWVFGSHVLAWAQVDGESMPDRRDELLERVRLFMGKLPYFFADDGGYSEFGRSLAYKFARLGAPLWAYKLGIWSHSTGMLRRLVGQHIRWYADRGAIRADGTLHQSLTANGSPEICERYISTGATYWAMQAFGGMWSLPDDDPFWTTDEEPLPAEKEDFMKVYHQPGWILKANQGEIQRFNAGSMKSQDAKYAKFVYSTRNPFNVGLNNGFPAPDNMLSLTDGTTRGQRTRNVVFVVDESGWLRLRWEQSLNGKTHVIDTTIIIMGEQHIRAHRIHLSPNQQSPLGVIEGCSPLGYSAGEVPDIRHTIRSCAATLWGKGTAGIYNITGYDSPTLWDGAPNINSVYPYYVLPVLTVNEVHDGQELMCLVHDGQEIMDFDISDNVSGTWRDDSSFHLVYGDDTITIPPLAE